MSNREILMRISGLLFAGLITLFFYIQNQTLFGISLLCAGIWMIVFKKEIDKVHEHREYLIKSGTLVDTIVWGVAILIVFGCGLYYLFGGSFP